MKDEKKGNNKPAGRGNIAKVLATDTPERMPPMLTLGQDEIDIKNLKAGDKVSLSLEAEVKTVVDDIENPTVTFSIEEVTVNE